LKESVHFQLSAIQEEITLSTKDWGKGLFGFNC